MKRDEDIHNCWIVQFVKIYMIESMATQYEKGYFLKDTVKSKETKLNLHNG